MNRLRHPVTLLIALGFIAVPASAMPVHVIDAQGKPVAAVMVSVAPVTPATIDSSDNGYAQPGKPQRALFETHRFTNASGQTDLPTGEFPWKLRLRKPGYKDQVLEAKDVTGKPLTLIAETDPQELANQRPANAWIANINLGSEQLHKEWLLHCNFCHQQGSAFLRRNRTPEEWATVIPRMMRYGARVSSEGQKQLPALLSAHWEKINGNPALVPASTPWSPSLSKVTVRELPLGDSMSQMHDLLYHSNGMVYVGDNLQDRIYEVNPKSGEFTVFKVPPFGSPHGGLMGARMADFPKHEAYQGIHSFAESPKDGHIFITPSYQRRLLEFDPKTKEFTYHTMDKGFYPHTLRFDGQDRVWFTLALSNQVAMFDRSTKKFSYYDLPFRSIGERINTWLIPFSFKLMAMGIPMANLVHVDHQSTGLPLPYGIDITPDGKAWFARLYSDEIGVVDPATGSVTMIPTPFTAPRRLRSDRDGNLWIVAFNESQIARYEPKTGKFTRFDLPVVPKGTETPYSLNVDKSRHQVWVNGTNSDSLMRFDIATETWDFIPMSRRVTFTRDVEFSPDGKAYISSASLPAWHIEDGQPTLMEVSIQK